MTGSTERLIILGSTITALAIARECRAMGLPCVLFATSAGPATHSRIPEVHLLESATDEEVLERLLSVAKETRSALIADSDSWLRWIMQHRDILQSVFGNILHPANEVLEVCLNKSRFIQWCVSKRIPAPTLYEATPGQNRTDMEYPVLLRPQTTRHGADDNLPKAKEISSDEDLDRLLERYRQHHVTATICQSLIRPNVLQYSVAVARNESGDTRVFVAQKIRPSAEKCAGGTYVIASPDTAVAELSIAAATALGLFGVAEIEIIKYTDTEDMFLIEINPRPWAQFALAWQSGFRFFDLPVGPGFIR